MADPINLPKFLRFKNFNYLIGPLTGRASLWFDDGKKKPQGVHELTRRPLPGEVNVFVFRHRSSSRYWRRSLPSNAIIAGDEVPPAAADTDCLFRVVQIPDPEFNNVVALQCLGNERYLARTDGNNLAATRANYTDLRTHLAWIEATRVDGVDLPEDSSEDDVFEGAQVLDDNKAVEKPVESDSSATAEQAI